MHTTILLITQAETKEEAITNVEDYMSQMVGNVIDYYDIIEGYPKPATECREEIEECGSEQNHEKNIDNAYEKMIDTKKQAEKEGKEYSCWSDHAIATKEYSELINDDFGYNTNIRDIDNGTSIVDEKDTDLNECFAVKVDYHS